MNKLDEFLSLARPSSVLIVDDYLKVEKLKERLISDYGFLRLADQTSIWCYSHPQDVARSEEATFIASDFALGPYINTISKFEARNLVKELFKGSMENKEAYIVPYVMGPSNSKFKRVGITITDSPYVVVNMAILNKIYPDALKNFDNVVLGFHSTASMDMKKKRVIHFTEDLEVYSVNTNYGGNVLTGKKCFSLRIASYLGKMEGWLAEHMLISKIINPIINDFTFIAALPSACGKTNLAMLAVPLEYADRGWSVETVGDDICWIFPKDGQLRVINPEYGFFGVAPGTSKRTNPHFMEAFEAGNCVFTNTAVDLDKLEPWWEGIDKPIPRRLRTWQNLDLIEPNPELGPFAHSNSRVTVPITNCPCLYKQWDNPNGHLVHAIIFGCRRHSGMPVVFQARSLDEAIYFATMLKSERTSAQEGVVGALRHDPFAMRPFFSYPIGEYVSHWLSVFRSLKEQPLFFFVNWFKKDSNGQFVWPGFGENIRILEWIIKRCACRVSARETFYGYIPCEEDINLPPSTSYSQLFEIDPEAFEDELDENQVFLEALGSSGPNELLRVQSYLKDQLQN